jgi:alkylated DNA repair dioxygenase AlkB
MSPSEAPVEYIPNLDDHPDYWFSRLSSELEWIRHKDVPRSEYFFSRVGKPYTYGKGRGQRTYSAQVGSTAIDYIQDRLEKRLKVKFDVCFLNRYHNQSDQLGWHADDSPEMDDSRPIVTVSLGVEREIWFRKDPTKLYDLDLDAESNFFAPLKQKLENGSALVMKPGMQDTWQHRIPKASFQCGERISLTFRGYVDV